MSLLDASVVSFVTSLLILPADRIQIPFQRSVFFLSVMGILMLAGNTAYIIQFGSTNMTQLMTADIQSFYDQSSGQHSTFFRTTINIGLGEKPSTLS
jgi:hypothetical protein